MIIYHYQMNRAERRSQKQRVVTNRIKELKTLGDTRYKYLCEKKNLLNKQDAFDCGNPKCVACSLEKIYSTVDRRGRKRRDNNYKGDLEDETK